VLRLRQRRLPWYLERRTFDSAHQRNENDCFDMNDVIPANGDPNDGVLELQCDEQRHHRADEPLNDPLIERVHRDDQVVLMRRLARSARIGTRGSIARLHLPRVSSGCPALLPSDPQNWLRTLMLRFRRTRWTSADCP
jgi:hypothetical protein